MGYEKQMQNVKWPSNGCTTILKKARHKPYNDGMRNVE